MSNSTEIKRILQNIANDNGKGDNRNLFFTAEVKKVDDETCDVEVGGFEVTGVHLAAVSDGNKNNTIIKPKKGSVVLVCDKTGGDMTWLNVVAFSEIANVTGVIDENVELKIKGDVKIECDKNIEFNGGNNEGLVVAEKTASKISNLEDEINQLKQILTAWVPAPMDGGGALKGAITTWAAMQIQPTTKKNDLWNDKIKH